LKSSRRSSLIFVGTGVIAEHAGIAQNLVSALFICGKHEQSGSARERETKVSAARVIGENDALDTGIVKVTLRDFGLVTPMEARDQHAVLFRFHEGN
jgi:hypothetical protein